MRDLLIVLATALLLRACEADGERAAQPSLGDFRANSESRAGGEWQRKNMDGRPVLLFGEPGRRPSAGISCDIEGRTLLIERMTVTPSGGIETMTVIADNRSRTLPVMWDGASLPIAGVSLSLDDRMVKSLARPSGEIELELGDEPELVIPSDRRIGELIEECRG